MGDGGAWVMVGRGWWWGVVLVERVDGGAWMMVECGCWWGVGDGGAWCW